MDSAQRVRKLLDNKRARPLGRVPPIQGIGWVSENMSTILFVMPSTINTWSFILTYQ